MTSKTTPKTKEQIRAELAALVIPKKSAHSFGAPWKPSR